MNAPTFSSRDFNREPGRIKRAAATGAVIITERGRPTLAVLSYAEYQKLRQPTSLVGALSMPGLSAIDLDTAMPVSTPQAASFD